MTRGTTGPETDVRRALEAQLRRDGARPLVTFYDDATGERVELSVVTYANWVAKTASLLQDELDVERGALALVDLPTHWLGPVWLGALWSLGVAVSDDPARAEDAALVVTGPDGLGTAAAAAARGAVAVATSLLPMAARFREPLPAGVVDLAEVVWSQPDLFVPLDPPGPDDVAWSDAAGSLTQRELLALAAAPPAPVQRVLTALSPTTRPGLTAFLGPLLAGAGTVWVASPADDGWAHRAATEQAVRWP